MSNDIGRTPVFSFSKRRITLDIAIFLTLSTIYVTYICVKHDPNEQAEQPEQPLIIHIIESLSTAVTLIIILTVSLEFTIDGVIKAIDERRSISNEKLDARIREVSRQERTKERVQVYDELEDYGYQIKDEHKRFDDAHKDTTNNVT